MNAAAISPDAVADLVENISSSIVRVDAGHRFGGTGTVWSDDLIVTASHVVEREDEIEIGFGSDDDKTVKASRRLSDVKATLVGRDESTNVALLRISGGKLTPAKFRSLDGLRVGHFVVAVARPGKTVRASFGIVSTLGAEFQTRPGARIARWLETDAEIAAGWSGGALVDLEGRTLGMNNRAVVRQAHLTIPHVTLERVVAELAAHGKIRRGYLGVGVHRVTLPEAIAKSLGREQVAGSAGGGTAQMQTAGALVHAVEPKSHADVAGILIGDVLLAIDGAKVESPWQLASVLREKVDVEISIELVRAGSVQTVKAHT